MSVREVRLGDVRILGFRDGFFSLDGGAMFGVVPKVLWSKRYPADGENRITLALNSFLIQAGGRNILVETGVGERLTDKLRALYAVSREESLPQALVREGIRPEEIDIVVNTHLHFDHCGGNMGTAADGTLEPVYPRAAYLIARGEWEDALHPNERDKGSYLQENFLPLERLGRLRLVEGEEEAAPGVRIVPTPGHTRHHQSVKIENEAGTVFLLGDLVPTSAHVRTSYVMSYDLFPLETMRQKKKFFDEGIAGGWIFGFIHDPRHYFGFVDKKDFHYEFRPCEVTGPRGG